MTTLADLPTPCLVLDRPRLQRNIDRMADRCAELGIALRPHLKTPKSIDVARLLMARQARGVTVSTLAEAEYFARHGLQDQFYAVPLAADKIGRIAAMARGGTTVLCVAHDADAVPAYAARAAAEGIVLPLVIDVDVDHHRSGIAAGDPAFLSMARAIHAAPSLALRGIMVYAGASYDAPDTEAIAALAERIRAGGVAARDLLVRDGLPCDVVSYGSSPGTFFARSLDGLTESRAGVYPFQDLFQAGLGACAVDDIALSVLTQVTGRQPALNRFFVDAGGLALSKDRSTAGHAFDAGYGLVCDEDGIPIGDLVVSAASQEIGTVASRQGATLDMAAFPPGRRLRILPNHSCFTAAAYERYNVVDGGHEVTAVWDRVNGW
ncbi:MAG: alanine racemase [Burkholderiaceae bacterium]|nr:alanine racemase [Burkholderiaceae bacterium]